MSHTPGVGVQTRGLVVIFRSEGHDVAALSGVDLDVAPGEVIGLLGPSGAGKSTLLSVLGGLTPPSAGRVRVGEHNLAEMSEAQIDAYRAGDAGMVLQGASRNLIPYLTPRENVLFAGRAARRAFAGRRLDGIDSAVPSRPDPPAVDDLFAVLGLKGRADRTLEQLSAGQRQLAAIAVGLAAGPRILLADEPTSQLDHAARDRVVAALMQANRELGTTVVVVTHDPEVAGRLPRTVTIRDGRVGGENRLGRSLALIAPDGSLPLPPAVLATFPPGTAVRVEPDEEGRWVLVAGE